MPVRGGAKGAGLLLVVLLLGMAAAPARCARTWLLLLGLARPGQVAAHEGSPPRPIYAYRTLVLTMSPSGVQVSERRPLLVARPKGLWRVEVERKSWRAWDEDVVVAAPLGAALPPVSPSLDTRGTSGYSAAEIVFVGPDHVGVSRSSAGYTEGAAHPWESRRLEVRSLDNLSRPLGIGRVLGNDALVALRSRAERYRARHPDERDRLEESPRLDAWTLVRRRGSWVVRGILGSSSEIYGESHAVFDVGVPPSARLGARDYLEPDWNTVFQQVPGALDAFSSPDGALLAVVTPGALLVYEGGLALHRKRPLGVVDLQAGETAVGIQWATGPTAERWRRELR